MEWEDIYKNVPLDEIPWHSEKPPLSLVRNIQSIERGLAIDLCCGAGTNSIFLAKNGFKVTGIDVSETAVKIARKMAEKEGLHIDFKVADVLDFRTGKKFDFAFDRGCFHHMPVSKRRMFAENLSGMLKKRGRFQLMAFSERNGFEKSLSKEEIRGVFSGFFEIGKISEEVHIEPDGSSVYLYVTSMTKL